MNSFLMHSHETERSRYQERLDQAELLRQTRAARDGARPTRSPRSLGYPVRMPVDAVTRLLHTPVRLVTWLRLASL